MSAGYVQESNVRYKIRGKGGYRQKVLQFHGVPVLGIGVGSRTYTNTVDYVIGGSDKPNMLQVRDYIMKVRNGDNLIRAGFEYTDDERIRKRLVLDLFELDLSELDRYHIGRYMYLYEDILEAALDQGLLGRVGACHYRLTLRGYKYRDIISWMLFSECVRRRDREFYQRLHQSCTRVQIITGNPTGF